MSDFDHKHISDPIYKTVGLSKLETEVIDTPVFQRLRRVKHLGLVGLVYPGADFSRFDHSLGVCHITGRILSVIKNANPSSNFKSEELEREIQKCRLAGLLHDIGHYPFSHPMERAIEEFYKRALVEQRGVAEEPNSKSQEENGYMEHEEVGEEILRSDPELSEVLKKGGYQPDEISDIFIGSNNDSPFGVLVNSDLDADRIDYLLRTAHHTGVPYGSIDLDYLISQMVLNETRIISLHQRALRSAEHFLLCRYFVYQQSIFHKTVAGFEYLLRDISGTLLEKNLVGFSREDIQQSVKNRKWCSWDDVYVEGKIRELRQLHEGEILSQKIDSIHKRQPASLVYEWELFTKREDTESFENKEELVKIYAKEAREKYKIDESLWHIWSRKRTITNLASHMKITDKRDDEEIGKSIRLYDPTANKSQVIMDNKRSLMSVMGDQVLCVIRVYVLLPEDKEKLKPAIREYFQQELGAN